MNERLRVAVAGAGFIGRVHVESARRAGADVVALASSTPERTAAAAKELGIPLAVPSVDALVAEGIDVLHVATPNDLHVAYAVAALEAGVHVVLEKPIARTPDELRALLAAANSRDLVVSVPFVYRFYATVRQARELVKTGAIGDLRLLHGHYLQDWLAMPEDSNWRVDTVTGGPSRAFADIGSHWCDLVQFVTGARIASVLARTSSIDGRSTEDVATVQFETTDGVLGSVVVSQVSHGRKNRLWFEVDGSRAALAFDQEDPERLWVGDRSGSRTVLRDPGVLSPEAANYARLPAGHPEGYADCFAQFVADTYAVVRGEHRDGLPVLDDGAFAVTLTDAVLRSALTHTWANVEDV